MKNTRLFLLIFLSVNFLVFSQDPQIDYAGELSKSVEVPQSPEAAAFEKYGNVDVSLYTGTPNISVPIYTINGREMDVPISLSYDASGVKVTQLASQVGLSWSLAVGGRISRVVNGMPDDYKEGDYATIFKAANSYFAQDVRDNIDNYSLIPTSFNTRQDGEDYIDFLYDININKVDVEPDYFSINVPGLNDHIVMDISSTGNMQAKALKNPTAKVEYTFDTVLGIINWTIVMEDGTTYFFDNYETTHVTSQDGLNQVLNGVTKEYNSSWVLTRIESPNKKDIYDFTYTSFGYWTQPAPIGASSVTNTLETNSGQTQFPDPDTQVTYSPEYKIKQKYLTSIKHNTKTIAAFNLGPRLDIERGLNAYDSALENIVIKDPNGGILKQYDLFHTYFGAPSYNDALLKQAYEVRLKLDSIQIKGNGANHRLSSYQFEYFSPQDVPSTKSFSQDYMGYYNNANNNGILYPQVIESGFNFHGADRSVDINYAIKGTIQKIIYPTGGSTEFFFSSNTYVPTSFSGNTVLQRVIKGTCSAGIAQGNLGGAGSCIEDINPNVNTKTCTFEISEDGLYDIVFERVDGLAFIHKLVYDCTGGYDYENPINPGNTPLIYPCLESSYVSIDPSTLCFDANSGSTWQSSSNYNSIYPGTSPRVQLTAGVYQITLFNTAYSIPNADMSITISREEEVYSPNVNGISTAPAGLKVVKTIDDPGLGQTPVEKTYQYITDITATNPVSSGRLLFSPKFYTFSTTVVQVNGLPVEKATINRVAQAAGGNQPHIVYSKVYEIEQNNGYIVHSFNTGTDGVVARSGPPYTNTFVSDFGVGKESAVSVYTENNELVQAEIKQYSTEQPILSQRGLSLTHDPTKALEFLALEQSGNSYHLTHVEALITPQGINLPAFCNTSNGVYCRSDLKYSTLKAMNSLTSGKAGHLFKNEGYNYYENGITSQVVDYIYNAQNLLKETTTTDSEGNDHKTINYYPQDFPTVTVYEDMANDHRLNTVVKTESYYNNVKTGTQQTAYKKWGTDIYLPEFIQASKDNLPLEERLTYHSYYTSGNVKEVSLKNGAKSVYIWGYDETFPIAKIENASYSEVSSQVSNLQSKSNLDTDRTIGSTGTEGTLRTALTNLRNSLPNAMVTTYTYDPLIGVTSITDASGQTIYYHYDNFNRLTHVMNKDGEVLSKNEYNYNNQN